ncbi:hypothetical protein SALBM135S_07610 [Streptomyces alboniger]
MCPGGYRRYGHECTPESTYLGLSRGSGGAGPAVASGTRPARFTPAM